MSATHPQPQESLVDRMELAAARAEVERLVAEGTALVGAWTQHREECPDCDPLKDGGWVESFRRVAVDAPLSSDMVEAEMCVEGIRMVDAVYEAKAAVNDEAWALVGFRIERDGRSSNSAG